MVRDLVHHEEPLAHHLLYGSHASFDCFLNLPRDEKCFHSPIQPNAPRRRLFQTHCCFRDPGFWNSRVSQLVLRAGFFVYYGITRTPQRNCKITYIESLPPAQWTFLNIFILFIVAMVQPVGYGIFKRDDFPGIGCCSRIGRFIIELSIFGGLKVIQDYLQLVKNALQI
jgi:hypothetical protein